MTMSPPTESLLKYDNPELVSKNIEKNSPKALSLKASPQQPFISDPVPPPPKPKTPSCDAIKTEDILNSILPPREWMENNQQWVQQVSSTPCSRSDITHLREKLDLKMEQTVARDTGICSVHRELYTQCFDELIRQVTINCAEKGVLLLQVRDEIRMTIAAYQTLYERNVVFVMKKALQAEQQKKDTEKRIADLENEKRELERQLNELKSKCEAIEKREKVEVKKRPDKIKFLNRTNQQLKTQFKAIIAPKKL